MPFGIKTLFSEHGIPKIQLNYIIHASEWAQIGVKLVLFRRKSGADDAGSLFRSFPNINFFLKIFHFFDPPPNFFKVRRHTNSYRGPNLGVSYLEIYVELRDFTSGTFFSYFELLYPNPLSHGPHRPIYPGFQTYTFSAKFTFWTP